MKVDPKSGVSSSPGASSAKQTGEGFRLLLPEGGAAQPARVANVAGAAPVSNVDALLALQGLVSPEARQRALRKGRRLLDALDRLQLALLGAGPTTANLAQLKGAAAEQREPSGDPGLDSVLSWAEVRVAVEAAKLERDVQAA